MAEGRLQLELEVDSQQAKDFLDDLVANPDTLDLFNSDPAAALEPFGITLSETDSGDAPDISLDLADVNRIMTATSVVNVTPSFGSCSRKAILAYLAAAGGPRDGGGSDE